MDVVAERMNALEVDSFAYNTMTDRVPNIIVKGLDFFSRTWRIFLEKKNGRLPEEEVKIAEEEAKEIIQSFSKLRYELTTNKPLNKLDDNWEDVNLWNNWIDGYTKEFNTRPTYFDAPMLYTECYVYRSICSAIQKTRYFKNFDIFLQIKRDGLISSERATTMIMEYTTKIAERIQQGKSSLKEEFVNYVEFTLWGNKCDLSLPIGDTVADTFNLLDDLKKQKSFILKNSTDQIYQFFLDKKDKPIARIDVVLDNAGFELISDFCFIEMLYQTGLIDEKNTIVQFHPKNTGWFVSDVLHHDLYWILNYLCTNLQSSIAKDLGKKWASHLREGRWTLKKHYFWTTGFEFPLMEKISVHLYEDLCKSDFILFKGDLNYRKLVSDMRWDYTTPFKTALRGFLPSTLATLRTIKFNPLCDLDEEQAERFKKLDPLEKHSGIYALISFYRAN